MFKEIIDFFSGISKDSWREVVITSFLIPLVFFLFTKLWTWFVSIKPINLVLARLRKSKKNILIFLSQLSGVNNTEQKYVAHFPQPLPQNITNLTEQYYKNVEPVWSQADGQCVAEIFNLLGQIKKHSGFRIADTIKDWKELNSPVFSIGFNPKTRDLMKICSPINFQIDINGTSLSIQGHKFALGSDYPADAGILQKTYMKNSNMPVFILAGLGTTGTEAAGKVLNENCIPFGKLYGSSSFCVLFKNDITLGGDYYEIMGIFPKPQLYRFFLYPITFIKWYHKKMYPTN
ncbi:MAG: hypothetical protein PHT25_03580 [Bacteroidales bacterium]|nr:hypothetical protein [Bacteroidales bacterium]